MSSRRKGDLSAVAKAEILSPEMFLVERGQTLHEAETSNRMRGNNGECIYGVLGSKVAAGKLAVMSELGRSIVLSQEEYRVKALGQVMKRNGAMEVGSVHSSTHLSCVEGTDTRTLREGRTVPDTAAGESWVKPALITDLYGRDVQVKSRMREIRTYGSVWGSRLCASRLNIVALRISKERRNGESKPNLKGV